MRIGIIGQVTLTHKSQMIFAKLGQQIYPLRQMEELAYLDGLWISSCQAQILKDLQHWRQPLQKQTHLAIMGAALGAVALGQNGGLAMMDYQARYKEAIHQTAELLRIPSWNDHKLTAVFGPEIYFEQIAPNLGILCQTAERGPIILRQGNFLAASFIPEESPDQSIYHYFLEMVRRSRKRNS